MRWFIDAIYLLAAALTLPVWMVRMVRTGKIRTDWPARFGRVPDRLELHRRSHVPRILLHAVSVGEVNAIRLLVERLEAHRPKPQIVVSTTTDTGFARAQALWGERLPIVRYPFDASFAVERFLRSVSPDVVALVELEVWPNFISAAARRGVPV